MMPFQYKALVDEALVIEEMGPLSLLHLGDFFGRQQLYSHQVLRLGADPGDFKPEMVLFESAGDSFGEDILGKYCLHD